MKPGTLYLVPAPLGEGALDGVLPADVRQLAAHLQHWIVEDAKTARRILKRYAPEVAIASLNFATLNEHTQDSDIPTLLQPLLAGHDAGLMSDAGCPGVADPGAPLVRAAHAAGIHVTPLVGPSSILLALMASGANGQRFRFHGYLPVDAAPRLQAVQRLERDSAQWHEAQLFIETPYRNDAMLDALVQACRPGTWLTVARDLTTSDELIVSQPIANWRTLPRPDLKKRPALYVLYAGK